MIKTGTKKVLLAAMALLGGNLAAGVVTIVNTTDQTWTLRSLELIARDHRDSVWNATTIGPAETVLMDHKSKRLSYWVENKAPVSASGSTSSSSSSSSSSAPDGDLQGSTASEPIIAPAPGPRPGIPTST